MINALIAWSLRRRTAVLALSLGLVVYGGMRALRMPVDVFPDLTAPTVTVVVEGHGMAPEEMERLVTFPVETAVNGATGVRRVRSATAVGIAVIWVEFEWGTDIFRARQTVNERLATVSGALPEQVEAPVLAPISSMMGEILFVGLSSPKHSGLELRDAAELQLRRRLLAVEGVSKVTPIGGDARQYQVVLAPQRLRALGISRAEVAEALRANNLNVSAGFVLEGGTETLLRGVGRFQTPEQIGATKVTRRDGRSILVRDLGVARIGAAIKRGTASVTTRDSDGQPQTRAAVVLAIQKQPQANTLELTRRLDEALGVIQAGLPDGMQVHQRLFRQADFIEASIENTTVALIEGALFVVLVVVLFLASLQASLITLLAMPLSLLVTVVALSLAGVGINTMTLGGMAIAIGSLVDDAIIDVENVVRRLRENRRRAEGERRSALRVILDASVEVRSSIVLATCIILLVFAPLFFLSGVEGRLLIPLGLAFCVALAASLLTALTVTPALCAFLLPRSRTIRDARETRLIAGLKRLYAGPLALAMRFPSAVVLPSLLALVVAVLVAGRMGRNFLPEFNEGALVVGLVTLPGTSLEQSDRLAGLAQERLARHPEVVAMARRTGRAEADEHVQGVESSEIELMLDMDAPLAQGLPRRSKSELLEAMRADLALVPGLQASFGQPISHRVDHMLSGTRANIAVKIFGEDLATLRSLAARVEASMAEIPGVVDLDTEQQVEIGQLRVDFDREALARHGLSVAEASHALEAAYLGEVVGQVQEGQLAYDLSLRLADGELAAREAVGGVLVETPTGARVPLRALARLVDDRGPNLVMREDVQRRIIVQCNVAGRAMSQVVEEARARIREQVVFPAGYFLRFGGQFESAEAAGQRLLLLGGLAILGIAFLLGSAFRSLRDVLLIMANLPLALIGGVAGVAVGGGVISIASIIGFVSVFGIAARNGIMLVSHVRHLQEEEGVADFREAVRRGAMERLAPILMTALSAGLALIPLALRGDDPGTEILTPMALVILFGLVSSTLLNMLVVPALFVRFGRQARPVARAEAAPRTATPATLGLLLGLLVLTPSCAQVEPQAAYARAADAFAEASGRSDLSAAHEAGWTEADRAARLADGLSLEEALELTLRGHPGLRARFLEIGIAHADWVQAQLLANPFLNFALRFPSGGGGTVLEAVLGFELLELWQAPRRAELAERQLDATVLQIAWEAARALDTTRQAYLRAVHAEVQRDLADQEAGLAGERLALVTERVDAGVAQLAQAQSAQLRRAEAEHRLRAQQLAVRRARTELARSLGVPESLDAVALADEESGFWLAAARELPAPLLDEAQIQAALARRLDLRAAAQARAAASARLDWERGRVWEGVKLGANLESTDAGEEFGPALALQLPVFDRHQAQIARAALLVEQAQLLEAEARAEAAQSLRLAAARFDAARTDWQAATEELLHSARQGVQYAEEALTVGTGSRDALLAAQLEELRVRRTLASIRLEFALAASALERELGCPLLELEPSPEQP